ncbi:SRPBCC family protein [Winogradskyella sp. DF17]|uniref:SRPBCC family protein n=1 Tax=Winogradskyella pelagia TaxID=2819984 RepID=A0ABS3T507_9FLAO|nr:SRPBCC family protein [Winogradskyella sp. DF17]MBO3117832.1 SRPBCC family protein [Winogradskyella sp. DF17]
MKYTTEIIIEAPLAEVIHKMDSVENMKHWQKGLIHTEHVSGTPGEFGAKMKLHYDFGNRKMELIETITKRSFPNEFHATYNTKGMHNIQQNYFDSIGENQTKWISKSEFQPTTFFMRAMLFLMPSAFKKQSAQYMLNFKNFVEQGLSVCDN